MDEKAYASLAQNLAQENIDVYVLKSPLELPVLNTKAAGNLIGDKQLDSVYLAGHSLGGVVAAMDSKESNRVKGLILLASSPSEKTDLSKKKLAVLSITASRDAVLNWDNYQSSKKRLPSSTEFFSDRRWQSQWIWRLWTSKERQGGNYFCLSAKTSHRSSHFTIYPKTRTIKNWDAEHLQFFVFLNFQEAAH
ncbi:Predicted dienelactone hydrolase [Chlamydia trachomatis]|nr:Predicted dienelactone hydrolase [Chlamydia trachomatis]